MTTIRTPTSNKPIDDYEEFLEKFWEKLDSDTPWGGHERKSGDIFTKYGRVTYITEKELPPRFHVPFMGSWVRSMHHWEHGFFYARDEKDRPFKQVITSIAMADR